MAEKKRYRLVAMTNAAEGREDEYNKWYQNTHLVQMCDLPGVVSAQRYRLAQNLAPGGQAFKYLAVYNIETDNIQAFFEETGKRAGTDRLEVSGAMSAGGVTALYEEFGAVVESKNR